MIVTRKRDAAASAPVQCSSCGTFVQTGAEHWCPPKPSAPERTDSRPSPRGDRMDRQG